MDHRNHRAIIILAGLWVLLAAVSAQGQTVTTTVPATYTPPIALAIDLVRNKIYVANAAGSNSGSVTIIDGANPNNTPTTIADTNANNPSAVAVNPGTNQIYVANYNSNNVTVISGATAAVSAAVSATIGVGTNPRAVAVNPVTNKVYVANSGSGNVTVIDGATNPTVSVGTNPWAVAVNPVTNKIYVANYASNNITVINGADNTTATVADSNAGGPIAVAVNTVTNEIYVANTLSGNVTVIDGATNNVTTLTDSNANFPVAVAVNPVTNQVYVANAGGETNNGNVTVISGAIGAVKATVSTTVTDPNAVTPDAVAVDPVTNQVYVATQGNTEIPQGEVTVIDGNTATYLMTLINSNARMPVAIGVNPVTNKIYAVNKNSDNVTVMDGARYPTTTVTDTNATYPIAVALNPVTNTAYVANNTSNNVTVISGSTYSTTVSVGSGPTGVAVNPVTNTIYVANSTGNNVTVIDGVTNNTTTVTDLNASQPYAVAVNPVTNMIYVANNASNNVTVIDGANLNNTPTTVADPNAQGPTAMVVNPVTNQIYVANNGSNNVTVIDGATNLTTTVADPNAIGPSAVAVNPVTNMIYVANYLSNNVSVIAGATSITTATYSTTVTDIYAQNPTAVAVNPLTNTIYVANYSVSSDFWSFVTAINGADNTYTSLSDPNANGPYAVAVNPVTNKIYVANFATNSQEDYFNFVTVIDGATSSITDVTIPNANAYPVAVAVNPVTNMIYVADSGSQSEGNTDTIIAEQQVQAIPIQTSILPLTGNQTTSLTPTFSFTASITPNIFLTAPTIDNLLFQVDTWQAPWLVGVVGAGPTGGNFNGTTPTPLQPGFHILYAYSTDGEEGASTNPGVQNSPLMGSITAYGFLVAAPEAGLSSGSLSFTNQAVGTQSAAQTVTLTNSGSAPLNIAGFAISSENPNDFQVSDNYCGSSLAGPGTCTFNIIYAPSVATPSVVGSETATLTVTDNSGDLAGSQQTINLTGTAVQATTTTTVVPSANPSVYGQSVTFTATVTPQDLGTPTGTMTFMDGATAICSVVPVPSGQAACAMPSLTVGQHTINTTYSGDSNFLGGSGTASQTVNPAATTTKIAGSAPSSPALGQPLTVSYTVTVNPPGAGTIPGGDTVTVTDSTGASCTGTVAAGNCALTPKVVGADTLTATYNGDTNFSKSTGSASAALAIIQVVQLNGLTATKTPDQSTTVGVALSAPATTPLNGTLTLSFVSNASGTGTGYMDPMNCFINSSNQCVTQLNFTIPAGATVANLPNSGIVQQGTTAGTISVTLTALTAGGTSVLPQPAPSVSVIVPPLAPVIKSVNIINETASGFSVQVTAYSTPRDLASVTFSFAAAPGTDLNGTSPPAVDLGTMAQTYFSSANGALGGGTFVLTVPFTYNGNTSALGSATVTLSNSVGTSATATGTF